MKQISVVTLLPSVIVSEGIHRILHSLKTHQITAIGVENLNSLRDKAYTLQSSLAFIDPVGVNTDEIRALKEEHPEMRIVAVNTSLLPESTTKPYDDIINIYDNVDAIEKIVKEVSQKKEETPKELSPREKEIVIGIVKGLSNKEIAAENNISVHTVMTHRKNIAAKLQIHSTAALTIYAIVSKLVKLDDIKT